MRFEISERFLARVVLVSGSLVCGFTGSHALASGDIVDRLQERYRAIKGYTAQFTEETQLPGAGAPLIKKGVVQILIPSKMRWDYTDPDKSDMVVDGARLWLVHSKRDEAFYWDIAGDSQMRLGYGFLMGVGDIRKSFDVETSKGEGGDWLLDLKPRDAGAKDQPIRLTVKEEPPRITGIEMKGGMGERVHIRFEGFSEKKEFPEGTFDYKPGPKTRVRDAREILAPPPPSPH